MYGICGILTFDRAASQPETAAAVQRMTDLMFRRGPDDEGLWTSPYERGMFGFRRLAILDLTQARHQPMISGDGRSAIVFNGEVYNFQDIRRELEALNGWGVDALPRLNGMFALAWYNLNTREMLLARDHAGIKPLYDFIEPHRKGIAFASQYNNLPHNPDLRDQLAKAGRRHMEQFCSVEAEVARHDTIYRELFKRQRIAA